MARIRIVAALVGMFFAAAGAGCSHQAAPAPATSAAPAVSDRAELATPQGRQAKQDFIARMKQAQLQREQEMPHKP